MSKPPDSVRAATEDRLTFEVTPERMLEVMNALLPPIEKTAHLTDFNTVEMLAGLTAIVTGVAREHSIPLEDIVDAVAKAWVMVEIKRTAGLAS